LRSSFTIVRDCMKASAESSKRQYDCHVRAASYSAGDSVLIFSPRHQPNEFQKWQRNLSTEATVIAKLGDICYVVKVTKNGKSFITHVDKIRLLPQAAPATVNPHTLTFFPNVILNRGVKLPPRSISGSTRDRKKISTPIRPFSGSNFSMVPASTSTF